MFGIHVRARLEADRLVQIWIERLADRSKSLHAEIAERRLKATTNQHDAF